MSDTTLVLSDDARPRAGDLVVPVPAQGAARHLAVLAREIGLPEALLKRDFDASAGSRLTLYAARPDARAERYLLVGLGEPVDLAAWRHAVRRIAHEARDAARVPPAVDLATCLEDVGDGTLHRALAAACAEGIRLGGYRPSDPDGAAPPGINALELRVPPAVLAAAGQGARRGEILGDARRRVMALVDLPGNLLTPEAFGEAARRMGAATGVRVQVLSRDEAAEAGLHAFLAVNAGSRRAPAFIVLDYAPAAPEGATLKTVGLVGKGVTFDSGGLSLKRAENLHYLKSDMAGGAAVLGAVEAAARLGLPVRVVGVIPATDNLPDGGAMAPGDVIRTLGGPTVEVVDTDAEGRLLLADGLAYLQRHHAPEVLLDLATLTGACVVALGRHAAGLFTENDALAAALEAAGRRAGERLWRLPLWPEYDEQLRSDVATLKNYGGQQAGAVTAARFLHHFAGSHGAWAHVDMAGPAFTDSPFTHGKSATGFGVGLVVSYLEAVAAGDVV